MRIVPPDPKWIWKLSTIVFPVIEYIQESLAEERERKMLEDNEIKGFVLFFL